MMYLNPFIFNGKFQIKKIPYSPPLDEFFMNIFININDIQSNPQIIE